MSGYGAQPGWSQPVAFTLDVFAHMEYGVDRHVDRIEFAAHVGGERYVLARTTEFSGYEAENDPERVIGALIADAVRRRAVTQ